MAERIRASLSGRQSKKEVVVLFYCAGDSSVKEGDPYYS
jgi:hypothetical protein